uniref:BPTI/Kunitz inhibitor domain-containing protein n=1 Tax=Amblyomma maculatum TaxID=34609 RepID=G3MS02_AMBMU
MVRSFVGLVFLVMAFVLDGYYALVTMEHFDEISARGSSHKKLDKAANSTSDDRSSFGEKNCKQVKPRQTKCKKGQTGIKDIFRYGFDKKSGKCFEYVASSCRNEGKNEYSTFSDCLEKCNSSSPCLKTRSDLKEFDSESKDYVYFDYSTDTCTDLRTNASPKNLWPNGNLFTSYGECSRHCTPDYETHYRQN